MSSQGFCQRLRQARLAKNLTQEALANLTGYEDRRAIWWIESGRGTPNIEVIDRLATALDVCPRWLAFGDSSPLSEKTTDRLAAMMADMRNKSAIYLKMLAEDRYKSPDTRAVFEGIRLHAARDANAVREVLVMAGVAVPDPLPESI